ncbi:hypothetical protein B0H13DRAFT_1626086, partial [Mycena leptocephala]
PSTTARQRETHLSAEEIHRGAVLDMYSYCFAIEPAQVWAYLWNRWYNPVQWKLWARAPEPAIPRLNTTMIVESLWRDIKHRDLAEFNRPRLDLVTHIVVTIVLPRVKRRLDYIRGERRVGRGGEVAGWQKDFRTAWKDYSRTDEHRSLRLPWPSTQSLELQFSKSHPPIFQRVFPRPCRYL